MICLIECFDQVGMLFLCLISVARSVPSTQVNRGSTFQIHQRVTEKRERGFSKTTNTDGDRLPDVSDTRSHCRQSTRNQTTRVRTAFRLPGSDKINRTASRVRGVSRGEDQHNTIREVTLDEDHGSRTRDDQHTTMRDVKPDGEI